MLITMTVIAAFAALTCATSVGYFCGRRAGTPRSTWKKRTSRAALGKHAVDLAVLVAARRIERRFAAESDLLRLRILAPLDLLRGSVTRMRSYRAAGW